jgi:hypothetical protein
VLGAAVALAATLATWLGFGRTPEIIVTPLAAAVPAQRRCERDREVVVLGDGSYELSVRRGLFDRHVVVQVPEGEIHDVGTVFGVSVQQGRTARVTVTQGAVVLHLRGVPEVRLNAGNVWEAEPRLELEDVPVAAVLEPEQAASAPVVDEQAVQTSERSVKHVQELHRHDRRRQREPAKAHEVSRVADARVVDLEAAGEDATYLRVLDLLRQRRTADAQRLAELYLERFPRGFRRPEVERIARPRATSE